MVKFLTKTQQNGSPALDLNDEAKTSVFVFLCLYEVFNFLPFGEIIPQTSNRGFVDYELRPGGKRIGCWVEVKRAGDGLRWDHIRKYLVTPGRGESAFRIGILTNLKIWKVFAYRPGLNSKNPSPLLECVIKKPRDFRKLERFIGKSAAKGGFKKLKRLHAESADVSRRVLQDGYGVDGVLKAMRGCLKHYRHVPHVPNNAKLQEALSHVLRGKVWNNRARY